MNIDLAGSLIVLYITKLEELLITISWKTLLYIQLRSEMFSCLLVEYFSCTHTRVIAIKMR